MKKLCRNHNPFLLVAVLVCLLVVTAISACQPASTITPTISPSPTSPAPSTPPPRALTVTATSPPPGIISLGYSTSLAASGGTTPYTWSVASGNLPPGLPLSVDGRISGTPAMLGNFNFTVRVTDNSRPSLTSEGALAITIRPPPLTIMTASLPSVIGSFNYNAALAASGGTPPYSWSIASGSLPKGLTWNAAGTISGTPASAGTSNFTVQVTDSSTAVLTTRGTFTITIIPPPLSITTSSLPAGKFGASYNASIIPGGGTAPYTWSMASGSLPPGLSLGAGGVVSGTPTSAGTFNFTIQARDSGSPDMTTQAVFSIAVAPPPPTITSASLPSGTVSLSYSASLAASNGVPPYTWSLASGSLPLGLLMRADGRITGIPTLAGTYNFTVRLVDSGSPPATAEQAVVLVVRPYLSPTVLTLPPGQL